jgi:predicted RNA polymerase sigma factor
MDIMDGLNDTQKEFLEILVYLFLRYNKFDEALALSLILAEYFPDQPLVHLSLAFAALQSGSPNTAADALKNVEPLAKSKELKKLFYILKSKTLWALGCDGEARSAFTHFLGIQEQDLRLAVTCSQSKTKVKL